jgi:putative flavoprotein involved in K+ transport
VFLGSPALTTDRPQLEDGRTVEVANVVWCTVFHPGFSWIDLPVLGPQEPLHKRGVVESEPGLYFIGLKFLYSVSSEQIHGVGRDAEYIAKKIAAGRSVRQAGRSVGDLSEERDVMARSAGASRGAR